MTGVGQYIVPYANETAFCIILGTVRAPGPPALMAVMRPSPSPTKRISNQLAVDSYLSYLLVDICGNLHLPVHEIVQVDARPIRLKMVKWRFSSCL